MGFTSEGNGRLREDANCPNKEIQHRVELFKFFLKILYGLNYSVMIVCTWIPATNIIRLIYKSC